ncbi:MAG: benzoate/H(+) symporter BenE family transporter [Deltaproteobacteria bacterium]|nr:benzoate/H(+) symporter BenE family transporter [Deltaproteobacteria bacterium]
MTTGNQAASFRESLRQIPGVLDRHTLTAGFLTLVQVLSGPLLLVYLAGVESRLIHSVGRYWFFAVLVGGGVLTLLLVLLYRRPIVAGFSVAGAAMLAQAMPGHPPAALVGAYLVSGLLMLLFAGTGVHRHVLRWVPTELMMGMMVGVLLRFGVGVYTSMVQDPIMVIPTVVAFLLAWRLLRRTPPTAVALIVGTLAGVFMGAVHWGVLPPVLTGPLLVAPEFSPQALLTLALPLAFIAFSYHDMAALGSMARLGWPITERPLLMSTGLFSVITAPMLGHGITLSGPLGAICANDMAHPLPEKRWGGALVAGILMIAAGVLAIPLLWLLGMLPTILLRTVAGLAVLPMLRQAMELTFSARGYRLGPLFAMFIAASDMRWLGLGAVFWALIIGVAVNALMSGNWRMGHADRMYEGPLPRRRASDRVPRSSENKGGEAQPEPAQKPDQERRRVRPSTPK